MGRVNCFEVTADSCRSLLHNEGKGKFAYRNLFLNLSWLKRNAIGIFACVCFLPRWDKVLGMCITEAPRVLLISTSSRRTSMVDVKLVLTHFDFHLNAFFITLCPKCDIPDVNSVNTDFLTLSSPTHITCYFETRPVLPQKSTEMHLVCTICSSTTKNECGDPQFSFHDFNKDSASFR